MVNKKRKSSIPKAVVLDRSGGAGVQKKKIGGDKGKGKLVPIRAESEESDFDDVAPAMQFDEDSDLGIGGGVEEVEEFEEFEEDEENDGGAQDADSFISDADSDEDEEYSDDSGSGDFDTKVAKGMERLEQLKAEAAEEQHAATMSEKRHVFTKRPEEGGDDEEEEEAEEDADMLENIPLAERQDRVQETLRVLDNVASQREGDHSRDEYLSILKDDLIAIYDYSEWLIGKLMDLFPPRELFEFLETNEKQRPITIRVNTLKTSRRDLVQALTRKGMNIDKTGAWCNVGLQIFESDVAVGSTAEYLAGHYLVQSASSFLPVLALDVGENMRILDMAAAPGGKTTHIAQNMKNTGFLMANDVSAERLIALRGNVLRMGITNCAITNYNGVGMERVMVGFDRVLLDAPCTGLGVISRDPRIKATKTEHDVVLCSQLQKKLLLSAIDCCKVGGFIVYSTCSILVEENELAVDYALKHRNVRIVDTDLPFGRPGMTKFRKNRMHSTLSLSRRYYPHIFNMDGFYVCKLEKLANGENKDSLWFKEKVPKGKKEKRKSEPGLPAPPAKVIKRKKMESEPEAVEQPKKKGLTIKETKPAEKRSRWKRKSQKDKEKKKLAKATKSVTTDKKPASAVKKTSSPKAATKKAAKPAKKASKKKTKK
eukprot:TRINITY_DN10537_c0_g1_i1.p1 TRINITY_DN10537_c0_g1~~TRINITY_DN10537_c0_g1_i1.p1  ORF type:complete len:655 (+),score=198.00 TRINITY_DN10537_c0_g1_i1:81-2045(+)